MALLWVPAASAEAGTSHHYTTYFANIIGIISAGEAHWYIDYPEEVHSTGTYWVAITVSSNAAASSTLTLSAAGVNAVGCTVGSLTTDTSGSSTVTGYIPITTTATSCTANFHMTLGSGATTISRLRPGINILSHRVLADDANGWAVNADIVDDTTSDGALTVETPGLTAATQDFTDTLCRPTGNHGHCELDLHGEIGIDVLDDTTEDGQLTVPAASVVGNASFPSQLQLSFPGDASNPSFDFWAGVIFWVLLLGFFLYQAWWFAAGFAVPGLLDAMFPDQIPDDMSLYLVFCLLGVVMEVAAHKFSWGHWRTRNSQGSGT